MAYLKPQSPIKNGEDHVYPLTTVDQIIKSDGSRLGSADKFNITASDVGAYGVDNPPSSQVITTGGSEGQLCAVNSNGTISPSSRTIASLGTGATYVLDGTTLYITTL